MILRPYQNELEAAIYRGWNEQQHQNVLATLATGGGKTVIFASILSKHQGVTCAIAHRQELVGQISMALARFGVRHKIIGPTKVIRYILNEQIKELGSHFYDPNSQCAVAGVDTLVRRADKLQSFLNQVTLWVQDEAHHVTKDNKWGKAAALMPNARGLGVTATPIRADGKGLGRHADGVMDVLVEGPSMRWLIDNGYLTDYRVFAPPSDLDLTNVTVSQATGDYNPKKLKSAVQKSHLVGDVVAHYLRLAAGKQGITFATDVETATEMSVKYNQAGVPAEIVSAKTPARVRGYVMSRFKAGELKQLVNVDLFGEGVDVPAIEVVSMARPTKSYGLYCQQFGRGLRLMGGKEYALIIDHASNVVRHGLPDMEREWSLDSRGSTPRSKKPEDDIPLRYCVACTQPYERIYSKCPWCGHLHEPAGRSKPEYVDGDLTELTPEILAEMRGNINRADESPATVGQRMRFANAPVAAINGAMKNIVNKQEAQAALRQSISWWAGIQKHKGRTDSESYKLFYFCFGVDVLTCQTFGRPDAIKLATRINDFIGDTR